MITTEITKLQYDIYGLLAERRLKDAFGKLALLVNELQDWVSRDKLNEMETSYRYMIQYMLDGVEDPERKSIYDHLVLSAYVLTDRVSDRLAGRFLLLNTMGGRDMRRPAERVFPYRLNSMCAIMKSTIFLWLCCLANKSKIFLKFNH